MIGRRGSFSFATLIANGLHAATAAVLLILATPDQLWVQIAITAFVC